MNEGQQAVVNCAVCRQEIRIPTDSGHIRFSCPGCKTELDWAPDRVGTGNGGIGLPYIAENEKHAQSASAQAPVHSQPTQSNFSDLSRWKRRDLDDWSAQEYLASVAFYVGAILGITWYFEDSFLVAIVGTLLGISAIYGIYKASRLLFNAGAVAASAITFVASNALILGMAALDASWSGSTSVSNELVDSRATSGSATATQKSSNPTITNQMISVQSVSNQSVSKNGKTNQSISNMETTPASGAAGILLSQTTLTSSTPQQQSCGTRGKPTGPPQINKDCYERMQGFQPNQGFFCGGGFEMSRHYSDTACDFETIKAELTAKAYERYSGMTRARHKRFEGTLFGGRLCSANFNENGKFDVSTKVESVTCEEAFVGIGQRVWPGVTCNADVSYTCSK